MQPKRFKFDPSHDELAKLYELHSMQEIADQFGVNPVTVAKRLRAHGIPTRRNGKLRKFDPSRDELAKLYELHSMQEIADQFGVDAETVRNRIHQHDIEARPVGTKPQFDPPKAELETLYQQFSMKEIARKFHVGETVVWKRLKQHGITLHGWEDGGHRKKPGRVFSEQHRANLTAAHLNKDATGARNPNWKGGATMAGLAIRLSPENQRWKREALKRAAGKCELCGIARGTICESCGMKVTLHIHHIKSFAGHPELRFDLNNAEVLCHKCHHLRHRQ